MAAVRLAAVWWTAASVQAPAQRARAGGQRGLAHRCVALGGPPPGAPPPAGRAAPPPPPWSSGPCVIMCRFVLVLLEKHKPAPQITLDQCVWRPAALQMGRSRLGRPLATPPPFTPARTRPHLCRSIIAIGRLPTPSNAISISRSLSCVAAAAPRMWMIISPALSKDSSFPSFRLSSASAVRNSTWQGTSVEWVDDWGNVRLVEEAFSVKAVVCGRAVPWAPTTACSAAKVAAHAAAR